LSNVPPSLAAVFKCLLETQDLISFVGDLQLNLTLQCVVMKNDEEGLIDNFVEKKGGKYIL
jgi:hypothetical protein